MTKKQVLRKLLRLYLVMAAILVVLLVALETEFVHRHVVVPFTTLVALTSKVIVNIFGAGATVLNNNLATSRYSINIVDGCNGIHAMAILMSGVLAYPTSIRNKLWGVLFGTAAIFVLNQVRVISLFYLGQHYPSIFNEVHVYVWQPLIIVWAIFVWDFWSRRVAVKAKVG